MRHHEVILGLALTACISVMAADTVRTAAGPVQGTTTADGTIRVYKGIPYAAPPVGDLRWKPPQPVPAGAVSGKQWNSRRAVCRATSTTTWSSATRARSEDCLYLNVWTPAVSGRGALARDGLDSRRRLRRREPRRSRARTAGTSRKKGVVVVTLNYRLGVFGFFALRI